MNSLFFQILLLEIFHLSPQRFFARRNKTIHLVWFQTAAMSWWISIKTVLVCFPWIASLPVCVQDLDKAAGLKPDIWVWESVSVLLFLAYRLRLVSACIVHTFLYQFFVLPHDITPLILHILHSTSLNGGLSLSLIKSVQSIAA